MSLSPSTLASSVGPKLVIVARSGIPVPSPPSARNSTGKAVGCQSVSPVSAHRCAILSLLGSGLRQAGQVALDVGHNDRDTGCRELLGKALQRLGLAGAGGPGDQPVPVDHGQRDADRASG